jgi:hypothetical protein
LEIEELRNNPAAIPEALRPRTLLRFMGRSEGGSGKPPARNGM